MIFGMSVPEAITVIGVLTGSVVTIINSIKGTRQREELKQQTIELNQKADIQATKQEESKTEAVAAKEKAAEASTKLDVIHNLTNSNLDTLKRELDKTKDEIVNQKLQISELMNRIMVMIPVQTDELEKKLDENTVATKLNTAVTKKTI